MAKAAFRHCDLPSRMRHFSVKQIERDHELAGRIKEVTAGVQRRRGHTSVGRPQMLHDIMSLVWAGMRDKAAGLVTYNTAIGALGTIQATQHAQRVFDEMDVQPDSITYSALIMAHHTNGDFGRVKQLTNDMLRLGFHAQREFDEMDVQPDSITALIMAHHTDGNFGRVNDMLRLGFPSTTLVVAVYARIAAGGRVAVDVRRQTVSEAKAQRTKPGPAVARERPAAVSSVVLQFYR
eukprot:gene19117-29446_t